MTGILWADVDPRKKPVQIKNATWSNKMANTPDRAWLLNYLSTVQKTLKDPKFITTDPGHPAREHYIDLFFSSESGHIMGIVVVAEVLPNDTRDFVTVIAKSTQLRQETGGVLYERS